MSVGARLVAPPTPTSRLPSASRRSSPSSYVVSTPKTSPASYRLPNARSAPISPASTSSSALIHAPPPSPSHWDALSSHPHNSRPRARGAQFPATPHPPANHMPSAVPL